MHHFDVEGYAADGQCFCLDCAHKMDIGKHNAEPIFAGMEVLDTDLTCDECDEVIIEAQRYDFSIYMEGTASYTYEINATNIESALAQARSAEDEDGDLLDEGDLETHDGEPMLAYMSGVKGPIWQREDEVKKPADDGPKMPPPYLVMHPVLREEFPNGIMIATDQLASDNAPMEEGLMLTFLAYVACVAGVELDSLSIYDLIVHDWEDGDWLLIT